MPATLQGCWRGADILVRPLEGLSRRPRPDWKVRRTGRLESLPHMVFPWDPNSSTSGFRVVASCRNGRPCPMPGSPQRAVSTQLSATRQSSFWRKNVTPVKTGAGMQPSPYPPQGSSSTTLQQGFTSHHKCCIFRQQSCPEVVFSTYQSLAALAMMTTWRSFAMQRRTEVVFHREVTF